MSKELVKEQKQILLEIIREKKHIDIAQLQALSGLSNMLVRELVWLLMDSGHIELTLERKLVPKITEG